MNSEVSRSDVNECVSIALETGETLRLTIPKPVERESYFVFCLYKAGSTLLNGIFNHINLILDIPEIGILKQATEQGIRPHTYDRNVALQQVIKPRGYCYLSFRYFFPFLKPLFVETRKSILLVRDPRDILTSAYFSEAYSHAPMPGQIEKWQIRQRAAVKEMTIDEFAIKRAPDILERLESYRPLLKNPGTQLFRYEDVIFSKSEWILEMLDHLGLSLPREDVLWIANLFDQRPAKENPNAHVRKVTPGDHREKLNAETIGKLNEVFEEMMTLFGYQDWNH